MRLPRQFVSSSKLISFHISLARLCEILEKICNGERRREKMKMGNSFEMDFFLYWNDVKSARRKRARKESGRRDLGSMNGYGSMTNGIQWVNERQKPSLRHGELIDFRIGRLKQLRDIGQARTVHRIALGMISRSGQIARSLWKMCNMHTQRGEQDKSKATSEALTAQQSKAQKKRANNKHQTIS